MAESAGDVDKLLDTLKSQGKMGHAVNTKVNSHQRLVGICRSHHKVFIQHILQQ